MNKNNQKILQKIAFWRWRVGGHRFESCIVHQQIPLEPQGFEGIFVSFIWKILTVTFATICCILRPFWVSLLQNCCKFSKRANPLCRSQYRDFLRLGVIFVSQMEGLQSGQKTDFSALQNLFIFMRWPVAHPGPFQRSLPPCTAGDNGCPPCK